MLACFMIVANPIHSVCPEERRGYPAGTEFSRSERARSTRPWAQSVILPALSVAEVSAAKDPGLIASAPVSELCVSVFSSPNLDALDAASSLSPLSATLTKNTGGVGHAQASARNPERIPSPFNFKNSTFNCFSPNRFSIRTCEKFARNPSTMNSSKTQDLKLFRMNSSKKTGEGAYPLRPCSLLTTHHSLLSRSILP
jgi:hypothetical protein